MEEIRYKQEGDTLTVYLSGRIDSGNAYQLEKKQMEDVRDMNYENVILDVADLEYISSAGLRSLMKIRKRSSKDVCIINAAPHIYDILEVTGFTELFPVSKKLREISVDGCEIIGKGFFGTVYRIDDETIVKVYRAGDSLAMLKKEKKLAKTALIAGVPTAISYDIVKVGDRYGSVFELLYAKTFNDLLVENPKKLDIIVRQYAEFLRLVHSKEVPEGRLASAREQFLGYLDIVEKYLEPGMYPKLKALISAVPEQRFIVHGDAQMKNIMLTDNGPMLIDMDSVCAGHPIFDIQSFYVTYRAFGEDCPNNSIEFLGLTDEIVSEIWDRLIPYYFATDDEEYIASLRDKVSVVGCIRFLFLIDRDPGSRGSLFDTRVKRTVGRLKELLERVESLDF